MTLDLLLNCHIFHLTEAELKHAAASLCFEVSEYTNDGRNVSFQMKRESQAYIIICCRNQDFMIEAVPPRDQNVMIFWNILTSLQSIIDLINEHFSKP